MPELWQGKNNYRSDKIMAIPAHLPTGQNCQLLLMGMPSNDVEPVVVNA
jgi:hypothetical protein